MRGGAAVEDPNAEDTRQALDRYTIDLTDRAAQGKLDPVIGRDDEIRRTVQVLQRRTKNNPVLIGEPGTSARPRSSRVWRSASSTARCPRASRTRKHPGARHGCPDCRRQVSRRVRGAPEGVLNELTPGRKADHPVYRRDCTPWWAPARPKGRDGRRQHAQAALARGELHCVGATTLDEYRKYVEKDAALERRFQKVLVDEPSWRTPSPSCAASRSATRCTTGWTDHRSRHRCRRRPVAPLHHATGNLPDKAIDLIDEAASRIRMEIDSKPEAMDRLERRIIQLKIEREALKQRDRRCLKETPSGVSRRVGRPGAAEYADLDEIWKAEKAKRCRVAQHIKENSMLARAGDREGPARRVISAKCRSCSMDAFRSLERQLGTGGAKPRQMT